MKYALRTFLCTIAAVACALCCQAQATTQPPPLRLTLAGAIERGLTSNLAVLTASAHLDEMQGALGRHASAAMLPRVAAQSYANLQNRNLRAFGISAPGLPEMVGPFSNYYVGVTAQQNIVDLAALRTVKASALAVDAVRRDEQDVRSLIERAVAAYYLNAQTGAARATAAQSRVNDAEALFTLAKDRHDAGAATGVDVLRAQVQLANERQALLEAQNQYRRALLVLERNIGLDPGAPIELAEQLQFQPQPEDAPEALVAKALEARNDFKSLATQRESMEAQIGVNRARYYPKFSVSGAFGGLGRSVGGLKGVGTLQGQVDFTLFDRDREGESAELTARLRQIDARMADLRRGIAEEVREAVLDLDSASAQVAVAEEGEQLARRELDQARDRFAAGATNNIEVITAQDGLARAEENFILAVSRHTDAKYALVRALGTARP